MVGKAFSLGPTLYGSVHKLRRSKAGVKYLKQTGQFKEYMELFKPDGKEFIAWDGEAWDDTDGEQRYMLLQCSTGAYIEAPELNTARCLELLLSEAVKNPGVIHVIYGGGYDATQILKDLPLASREAMKDNKEVWYFTDETENSKRNNYKINYLPHKWLEIRGYDWESKTRAYIKIYDVMTFFQMSFMKALDSRGIKIPQIIRDGKAARGGFLYSEIADVMEYCQMELELLVTLCNQLRAEFQEAGIKVRQYHGPGAVATALFKEHDIRPHMRPPELEIEQAAQRAYFGGRFEQFKAGHHAGEVYLYDINSAYPYHISELPSLDGAEWEYSETFAEGEIGVWNCSYQDYDKDFYKPHPLPWRGEKGEVGFPANNVDVWLWHPEAKYATTVNYGYILRIKNETKPFAFVKEMFEKRRIWKREGKGGERALKLGMNSLYGKMCQRIGGNPDRYEGRPAWHQIEWAGIVTSSTRAQLWEAIQLNPTKIISVETDSICSSVPLDLDIGPGLGQWEETKYDWITYIQSGIYFTSTEATGMKSKTRGIDVTQLDHDEMLEFLASDQTEPLQVNSRQFIGIGNPRTYLYGQWQDSTKDVKVAGDKRRHIKEMCHACKRGDSMAKKTHNLAAAMHYGLTPSAKHPLPWLDGITEAEPEFQYAGDAIEEFDKARKTGQTLAQMIASVK